MKICRESATGRLARGCGAGYDVHYEGMSDRQPFDPFLPADAMAIVALDVARRTGLLDALFDRPQPVDALGPILCHLLVEGGVARSDHAGQIALAADFHAAWVNARGDLAERLAFQRCALADMIIRLETLCFDVPAFIAGSATFGLFRYDRAMTETPEDLSHTRRWVAYVEALSRHEAPALTPLIDLTGAARVLEIGGNTGVMAEALLSTYPELEIVIMDLPAVCALGMERAGSVQGLSFVAADARTADWREAAGPVDAVLFKSVLHDWPEVEAVAMLDRAIAAVPQGGRVIVAERGPMTAQAGQGLRASDASNLVFAPFFRDPAFYQKVLYERGCAVTRADLRLDMAWHVVTAVKA